MACRRAPLSPRAVSQFLGGLFVLAALPSGFVRLAFGATVQQALRDDRRGWIFNIVMAALLVASVALVIS
jgi:threonine/homoserine/homoserine lactone efflux protein